MKKVNKESVQTLPILAPPLPVQRAVTQAIDEIACESERLCEVYTQKLSALDALKKSLLHQAFSGTL